MTWGWLGKCRALLEFPEHRGDDAPAPQGRARVRYNDAGKALEGSVDGGPYVPLTMTTAPAAVAAVAELSLVDDQQLDDATTIAVASVKDQFYLDSSSARPIDDITVAPTLSGAGRWIRRQLPSPDWATQDTWYIDPAGGDDEADGSSQETALATWDELRRRVGKLPVAILTVNLLGDPGDIVCDFNCVLPNTFPGGVVIIQGVRAVASQAVIAVATPHDNAAQIFGALEFGADESANAGRCLEVLDGAAAGAIGFYLGGSGNIADTGPFSDPLTTGETFPGAGDTVAFCDLTPLRSIDVRPGCWAIVNDCQIAQDSLAEAGGYLLLNRCRVDGRLFIQGGTTDLPANLPQATFFAQGSELRLNGASVSPLTMWCRGLVKIESQSVLHVQGESTLSFYGGTGATVMLNVAASTVIGNGAVCFYDVAAATTCCRLSLGAVGRFVRLWGREIADGGLGNAMEVRGLSGLLYVAAAVPDFAPNEKVLVGGAAGTIAVDLPLINPANNAAIVVDA